MTVRDHDLLEGSASVAANELARLQQPGEHGVTVPIVCVLSRFGLRRRRHLLPTLRDYRRVVKQLEAAHISGFLKSALVVENSTTFYTISLWRDIDSIPVFGTRVPVH